MKIGAIPFTIGFAKEVVPTPRDPLSKKTSPSDDKPPSVVGLDRSQDSAQKAVRPIVNGLGLGLEFSVDKDTGLTIIKVLDVETGEVVRQIPPEEVLTFMREFEKNGPLLSRWL